MTGVLKNKLTPPAIGDGLDPSSVTQIIAQALLNEKSMTIQKHLARFDEFLERITQEIHFEMPFLSEQARENLAMTVASKLLSKE